MSFSGSPTMFLIILNLSGNSPMIGFTFSATGLYFFFVGFLAALVITGIVGSGFVVFVIDDW